MGYLDQKIDTFVIKTNNMLKNYFILKFLNKNFIGIINLEREKNLQFPVKGVLKDIPETIWKTDITSIYTMWYFSKDFEENKKGDFIIKVEDKIYQKTNLKSISQLKNFLLLYFPGKLNDWK